MKHGMCGTRLYRIWGNIKGRCYCKSRREYKNYGGRGIKICDEWISNFQAFYDWAISNGYKDDLTIDRINVNGNYEPNNCRWITNKEQQCNRQYNRIISYNGKSKPLSKWAEEFDMCYKTLQKRVNKWGVNRAFETPKLTHFDCRGKNDNRSKQVWQYSLTGDFIKIWDCIKDIKREKGYSNCSIINCCKKRYGQAYGFIWCYKGEKPNLSLLYKKPQRNILQYNKNGEFIKKYDNAYEAGKLNGINHGGIRMACSGLRKTYKGFVWKYV